MGSPANMHASGCNLLSPLSAATRPLQPKTLTVPCQALPRGGDPVVLGCCPCGRRHLLGASAAALLPVLPSKGATGFTSDPKGAMEKFHPPRPDWYEEFYAQAMQQGMRSYEAEIAGYKAELFDLLRGKSRNVLELGVGTGPNFKYYASAADLNLYGIDPNKQMEKYARAAAVAAGLPLANFTFMLGVGEALPVRDNSMDAVIGTLVLCSVRDVDMALKEVKRVLKPDGYYLFIEHVAARDGSILRLMQGIVDPLQQFVSDGCHLTRETGKQLSEAGFSSLRLDMASLATVSLISPHIYGFACK